MPSAGATVTAGSLVVGQTYTIITVGTTNFVAIGAASNTVGVSFTATGVGTGTGTASLSPPGPSGTYYAIGYDYTLSHHTQVGWFDNVSIVNSSGGLTFVSSNPLGYGTTTLNNTQQIYRRAGAGIATGAGLWTAVWGMAGANNAASSQLISSDLGGTNSHLYWQISPANGGFCTNYHICMDPNGTENVAVGGSLLVEGNMNTSAGQLYPLSVGTGLTSSISGGILSVGLTSNLFTVTAGTGLSGGGTAALGSSVTLNNTEPYTGILTTAANCSSGASPASCGGANAGHVAIPTGASSVNLVVDTTAVTASSEIILTPDSSPAISGVTCNTSLATLAVPPVVTARSAGTSFTISYNGTIATNPVCIGFVIVN